MKRMLLAGLVGLLVGLGTGYGLARTFPPKPKTFDECMLRHMKAGMSDAVAQSIAYACRQTTRP